MDNQSRYYITTAIDYPNSRPHIGTAFEKIGADVQARFRRMEGDSVHFLMGNDENTIKVPAARPRAGRRAQAIRRRHGPAVSGSLAGARHLVRRLHPDQRRAAPRRLPEVHPGRLTTRATSTRESTPVTTAPAARRSRPRKKSRRGADAAPTTPARRSPGSRRKTTSSGSRPIATACWRITRRTRNSSSPKAGATRSSTWSNPSSRTSPSPARGLAGASRSRSTPTQTIYVWFDALLNYITGDRLRDRSTSASAVSGRPTCT